MPPEVLAKVVDPLRNLFHHSNHPQLLAGLDANDDAAIYKINDSTAIIQTLDFITPLVDDPYDFGVIAAANAISDVYAMGGEVKLALNICGFPPDLPSEMISKILQGGADVILEAGAVLAGGHTIDDKEPKYGLSVMGMAHPDHLIKKSGAQVGDVLVLTKPLGSGIITTAFKGDEADPEHFRLAVESMKKLNHTASQLFRQVGANAGTDVTGFALLGHALEIAKQSDMGLKLFIDKLPFLDGAIQYAGEWLFPGASCDNQKCFQKSVNFSNNISEEIQMLLFTPETSGGLLFSVAQEKIDQLDLLFSENSQQYWKIGEIVEGSGIQVLG